MGNDMCNSNGVFKHGACECNYGFSGLQCEKECNNRGEVKDGACVCRTEYDGEFCAKFRNRCSENSDGGRMDKVTGVYRCICASGFSGEHCTVECSGHGKALKGKHPNNGCVCNDGWENP